MSYFFNDRDRENAEDEYTQLCEERDLYPPHVAGGGCPKCAAPTALAADEDSTDIFHCEECCAQIDKMQDPDFHMTDILADIREERMEWQMEHAA